jgi:hypothetical protein
MIIKFKSEDTWVVFGEIDHVEYGDIDIEKDGVHPDAIVYDPPSDQEPVGKQVGIGFFTKNMNDATQVVAYSPIYLMNDQGRTVETI